MTGPADAVAAPVDEAPKEPKQPKLGPTLASKAAPAIARKAAEAGEALTLDQHLALGYRHYVHGPNKSWSPEFFAGQIAADKDLAAAVARMLADLNAVVAKRREGAGHVVKIQIRALSDALAKSRDLS